MRPFLLLLSYVTCFCQSCKNDENNFSALSDLSLSSVRKSNDIIAKASILNYQLLEDKLNDEALASRIKPWNDKAVKLKALTKNTLEQISILRNINAKSIGQAYSLRDKYQRGLLLLDSSINNLFHQELQSFLHQDEVSLPTQLLAEKTKNDVLVLEFMVVNYFNEKTRMIIENFTSYSTIAGVNTTHLHTGETLEITAGLAAFEKAEDLKITINDSIMQTNTNGFAVTYKMKVSGKGKKKVPVNIQYLSGKGTLESKNIIIEYEVE